MFRELRVLLTGHNLLHVYSVLIQLQAPSRFSNNAITLPANLLHTQETKQLYNYHPSP